MDDHENGPTSGQYRMMSGSAHGQNHGDELDVWKLLSVIRRRLPLIGFVSLSIIAFATLIVLGVTPRYSSEAKILIENGESTFTRPQGATATTLAADQAAVLSEVQVLLSRDLAAEVSAKVGLADIDEFSGQGRKKSLAMRLLSLVGIGGKKVLPTDERVIDTYFELLSVQQVETARVVAVRFSSEDANLAANVTNTLADTYIASTRKARFSSDKDAAKWLKSEIDDLRGKVAEAEQAVERFRAGKGLLKSGRDVSLNQQQLGQINTQLLTAQSKASEARTRAALVSRLIKKPGGLDAAAEVLNSRLIQRLRELQAAQSRNFAELSASLLPGHPRMRQLRAEQADIERRIRTEIKKIARGLENEADIADTRVKEMLSSLDSFKTEASNAKASEVKLRALERESKAQRDLLESFLSRYREATARGNMDNPAASARIISRATVASRPSYPAKGALLALSSVAAVLLSLVVAFLVDLLAPASKRRNTAGAPQYQSLEQVAETGLEQEDLPSLADTLRSRSPGSSRGSDQGSNSGHGLATVSNPGSVGVGAIPPSLDPGGQTDSRGMSSAEMADHDGFAHPFSGQTDTVSTREVTRNIARLVTARSFRRVVALDLVNTRRFVEIIDEIGRALTQAGRKAVLIEAGSSRHLADLERVEAGPGLAELLSGTAGLGEAMKQSTHKGLALIPGGSSAMPALAAVERLTQIVEALETRYDVVIILAGKPSVQTLGLAASGDLTVLTTSPDAVSNPKFKSSIEALANAGVDDAIVITAGEKGIGHYEAISSSGSMPHVA